MKTDLEDNIPSIREFYRGRSIFITGGTGFMGKVLIEKLLRSCEGIEKIYVLVRPKKGKTAQERIPDIVDDALYEKLLTAHPNIFKEKVFAIAGDVNELGLGISAEDRKTITENVSVIFHVAASVRFDDPMKKAVIMNVRGSRELLALAEETTNLVVLMHVSTTYSNTDRNPVEEALCPPHADWRNTIDIVEKLDNHTVQILTPKYLGNLPNTYTFTKGLAEHVMNSKRGKVPIVILRPSIVISTLNDPICGWINNFNGPVGLLVAGGKGIMRSIYTDPDIKADYVPVDIAIRAMIVAAWQRGIHKLHPDEEITVINCCASGIKQITFQQLLDMGMVFGHTYPLNDILWIPDGSITPYYVVHYIKVLFLHLLPAFLVDIALRLAGKKPMLVKLQRRIYIANLALHYYITNQWKFINDRFIMMRDLILPEDIKDFSYPFEHVDVHQFFLQCVYGGRKYLLKEPDETLPYAKRHFRRMYILDKTLKGIFWCFLFWWLFNSSQVQKIIHGFTKIILG